MYKNYLKYLFDFTADLTGLLLLSPIFVFFTIGLGSYFREYKGMELK